MDVFVSHANADQPTVERLLNRLAREQPASWRPMAFMELRDDWRDEASRIIPMAGAFLLVTTRLSIQSEACLHELEIAGLASIPMRQWLPRALPVHNLPMQFRHVPVVARGFACNPNDWQFRP